MNFANNINDILLTNEFSYHLSNLLVGMMVDSLFILYIIATLFLIYKMFTQGYKNYSMYATSFVAMLSIYLITLIKVPYQTNNAYFKNLNEYAIVKVVYTLVSNTGGALANKLVTEVICGNSNTTIKGEGCDFNGMFVNIAKMSYENLNDEDGIKKFVKNNLSTSQKEIKEYINQALNDGLDGMDPLLDMTKKVVNNGDYLGITDGYNKMKLEDIFKDKNILYYNNNYINMNMFYYDDIVNKQLIKDSTNITKKQLSKYVDLKPYVGFNVENIYRKAKNIKLDDKVLKDNKYNGTSAIEYVFSYLGSSDYDKSIIDNMTNNIVVIFAVKGMLEEQINEALSLKEYKENSDKKQIIDLFVKNRKDIIKDIDNIIQGYSKKYSEFMSFDDYKINSYDRKLGAVFYNENIQLANRIPNEAQTIRTLKNIRNIEKDSVITLIKDENNLIDRKNAESIVNAVNNKFSEKAKISRQLLHENSKLLYLLDNVYRDITNEYFYVYSTVYIDKKELEAVKTESAEMNELAKKYSTENGDIAKRLRDSFANNYHQEGLLTANVDWTRLGSLLPTLQRELYPTVMDTIVMTQFKNEKREEAFKYMNIANNGNPNALTGSIIDVMTGLGIAKGGLNIINGNIMSGLNDVISTAGLTVVVILFINVVLPAFIWMFLVVSYYFEVAVIVALVPASLFLIMFDGYRQHIPKIVSFILGLMFYPIILVVVFFTIMYFIMISPIIVKVFLPFLSSDGIQYMYDSAIGSSSSKVTSTMANAYNYVSGLFDVVKINSPAVDKVETTIAQFFLAVMNLLMYSILILMLFKTHEFMGKILNMSMSGDIMNGQNSVNKFASFDKTGITNKLM